MFGVSFEETGARQLFIATSGVYLSAKLFENSKLVSGIPASNRLHTSMLGADAVAGNGAYLVNWNGEAKSKQKLLKEYREKNVGVTV